MIYGLLWFAIASIVAVLSLTAEHPIPLETLPAIAVIFTLLCVPISTWLARKVDLFDPPAIFCLFGLHYFVFAPIYQYTNQIFPYIHWNSSLDRWVSSWFWMNAAIITICFIVFWRTAHENIHTNKHQITLSHRSKSLLKLLTLSTFALKSTTIVLFGGILGVSAAYQDRLSVGVLQYNPFAGMGSLVLLGDMFPICLGLLIITKFQHTVFLKSMFGFALFACVIAIISLGLNGLAGSRSSTLFSIVIVCLYYHIIARRLSLLTFLSGILIIFAFLQLYLSYKFGGFAAIFDETAREVVFSDRRLDDQTSFVLVRDLSRMDMQVIAMQAVFEAGYPLSWGRSLISGVLSIVPSSLFPARGLTFVLEKSEIVNFGRTFTRSGGTTFLFGMPGELIVNFGWGVLLFGAVLGRILTAARRTIAKSSTQVNSALLSPPLVITPVALLLYDSNALLLTFVQIWTVPLLLFWFRSKDREKRPATSTQAETTRNFVT